MHVYLQLRITPLYPVNTKRVRLLQERTLNSPTAHVTTGGRHQYRRKSLMTTHETAYATPNHCLETVSRTLFNHRPQPISEVCNPMCKIATLQ